MITLTTVNFLYFSLVKYYQKFSHFAVFATVVPKYLNFTIFSNDILDQYLYFNMTVHSIEF